MTDFNLRELVEFFENPEKPMPPVVRLRVFQCDMFDLDGLHTNVIEWKSLNNYSPEIANKIEAPTLGKNIPIIRRRHSPIYFIYHPDTGEYLGKINISL